MLVFVTKYAMAILLNEKFPGLKMGGKGSLLGKVPKTAKDDYEWEFNKALDLISRKCSLTK